MRVAFVSGNRERLPDAVVPLGILCVAASLPDRHEKAVVDLRASNRDLREVREGLDRAGRLAAVGRLAAGVAHEVGNPMGAMLAFIDLARRDLGLSDVWICIAAQVDSAKKIKWAMFMAAGKRYTPAPGAMT